MGCVTDERAPVADDAEDENSLDVIFTVPARLVELRDGRYVEIFWRTVNRLKRDARGMVLGTTNLLLIERLATVYVQIKHHEDEQNFRPGQQKDLNDYFVKLEAEYHKQITASSAGREKELMRTIVQNVVEVVSREIPEDQDRLRVLVLGALKDRFKALNI